MRSWGVPRVVVTDKLKSDDVALRDDCSTADHRSHKGLNNRLKPRTGTPGDERRSWRGSNHRATLNDFSPPMIRSPPSSAHTSPALRQILSPRPADAFALWDDYAARLVA